MTDPLSSEKSIFLAALDQQSPGERAAYLDRACAGDGRLRAAVEELLAAHQRLDHHRPAPASDAPAVGERPGMMLGPYKLLQVIGEGGMASCSWPSRPNRCSAAWPSRSSRRAW